MKILKKSICAMLLTISSIFPGETIEGILQLAEPDCAVASITGIAADSPKSDISLSDPIDLEISAAITLASMLPHLAESSKKQIEDVIAVLHGSGYQKFKDAETMLRACEIIPDEAFAEEEGLPAHIEQTSAKKNQRLLNKDVLHVLRSLEVYIRDLPTEDGYDADVESRSVDSGSSKNFG